jgi:hypothetical protein
MKGKTFFIASLLTALFIANNINITKPEILEGRLIEEKFYPESIIKRGGMIEVIPEKNTMVVKFPDGSKRTFQQDGDEAAQMEFSYNVGDTIKVKKTKAGYTIIEHYIPN